MYIFSTFEHSTYLELALSSLEEKGMAKEHIYSVPLDKRKEKRKLFDTIHRSDGVSLFDKGSALATAAAVVGGSAGFVWAWGPIYWGLIFAVSGFVVGFTIDLLIYKKTFKRNTRDKQTEVIMIITCPAEQVKMIEQLLWQHYAIGMAAVDDQPT